MFGLQYVLIPAVMLVIPVAIVLGHRRPTGSLIVCATGALGAFAAFWLILGGINALLAHSSEGKFPIELVVFVTGLLLLIVAWALAIYTSTQARHWWWVALLIVAGYLSFAAIVFSIAPPDRCTFAPPPSEDFFYPYCDGPNVLAQVLVLAGYLAGPAAALAYGLPDLRTRILDIRIPILRPRYLPEGLSVSPLSADGDPAASSAAPASAAAQVAVQDKPPVQSRLGRARLRSFRRPLVVILVVVLVVGAFGVLLSKVFPGPGGGSNTAATQTAGVHSTPSPTSSLALAGIVTEYPIPSTVALGEGITSGPDGALWFTEHDAGKIGRITTGGGGHS